MAYIHSLEEAHALLRFENHKRSYWPVSGAVRSDYDPQNDSQNEPSRGSKQKCLLTEWTDRANLVRSGWGSGRGL
eukprot:1189148-Prorocentrum_minimum.AAC.4